MKDLIYHGSNETPKIDDLLVKLKSGLTLDKGREIAIDFMNEVALHARRLEAQENLGLSDMNSAYTSEYLRDYFQIRIDQLTRNIQELRDRRGEL